ncbi:hypothetical protein H632_c673p2 [Helicosporidium sp. ATCC 50920]|nr:hypothetical protein H632_c673p2 [Helicosporidium sp. ATCC 50920]|eukprot:KDD75464.1 hypothetical protein H632_c673p2 [Helicosporidium sp. ATCC 50920]
MEARGDEAVGWYHSHPVFDARPSQRDNANQCNYQALCERDGAEPWVGAIVAPYDQALPSPASRTRWWVVRKQAGRLQPYAVAVTHDEPVPVDHEVREQARQVLLQQRDDVGRLDLAQVWRSFSAVAQGEPQGGPLSRVDKLMISLRRHLPAGDEPAAQAALEEIRKDVEQIWGVQLGRALPAEPSAP